VYMNGRGCDRIGFLRGNEWKSDVDQVGFSELLCHPER
jgi:hypothetical protein